MKIISTVEAAKMLGVHPVTVGRWIRTGRLKATPIGANYAIDPEKLAKFKRPIAGRPPKPEQK